MARNVPGFSLNVSNGTKDCSKRKEEKSSDQKLARKILADEEKYVPSEKRKSRDSLGPSNTMQHIILTASIMGLKRDAETVMRFVKGKDGCLLIKRDKMRSSNRKIRKERDRGEESRSSIRDRSKSESIVAGSCSSVSRVSADC